MHRLQNHEQNLETIVRAVYSLRDRAEVALILYRYKEICAKE